jgi:membrane protein DedA with SNARE-associated domain
MFQNLEAHAQSVVDFVREREAWAAPIALALAFGESLAFVSLLIPAWAALISIGVLIGAGHLDFWPIWIAAAIGAALGDWVSYWVGLKVGTPIARVWPLSRQPELLPRGEAFVRRWGAPAIFIGRFFGPLRASVPLAAGIFRMSYWHFQLANFSSAFVWAGLLLAVGDVVGLVIEWAWR